MAFPTYGSWISGIQDYTSFVDVDAVFTGSFISGSSNIEYAVLGSDNTVFQAYAQAVNGTNTIDLQAYVGSQFRMAFRLIGYPGLGFNPVVSNLYFQVAGAQMQTINLGSNNQLSSTKFTKAYIMPEGSYYWLGVGSVSSDGGTTWTAMGSAAFGQEFAITSTTGSEPIVKYVDNTGSAVLSKLTAYFHMADVN